MRLCIGLDFSSAAAASATYPIDIVGGVAPVAAYGTKKLRSAYSGPALRVVRPSDSATQDIGFVGQNLDTAAIISFLGGQFGKIDIWYDQMSGANHATQTTDATRPTIAGNSYGGVSSVFHVDGFLNIPAAVATNRQSFDHFGVVEAASSATQSTVIQVGTGANQATAFTASGNTGNYQGNPGVAASSFSPQTRPLVLEYGITPSAGTITQGSETKTTAFSPASQALAGGTIGSTTLSGGYINNRSHCHIIYARNVTTNERTAMRGALNTLYGITPNPSNRLVYMGDSITAASSPANIKNNGYFRQAIPQFSKTTHVYNLAGGGLQLQNEVPIYATRTGAILTAYADNRVCFLAMGTNDLTIGARTDVQIYADIQSYASSVRGSGGKIIVSTILPNSAWTAGQQTTRTNLNTSIRSNWNTFADGLCDFAADATMGPQAAASNASLYIDGLHPTELGHSYLAPLAATAINALLT